MRRSSLSWLLVALTLSACGASQGSTITAPVGSAAPLPEPAPEPAPLRLSDQARPTHYRLALSIDPSAERFSGTAEIDVTVAEASRTMWIHGEHLDVTRAVFVGPDGVETPVRWQQVEDGVARLVAEGLFAGSGQLRFEYTAPFDETLEGLYRVSQGDSTYAFTQFEAIAARKAFPCFDEPRFKVPFDLTLDVPEGQRALANSREVETVTESGRTRTRFATTENLPTYLVAFAVGPFDVVEATIPPNAVRTQPLALRGIAPHGRGPEMAFAMQHTPRIVAALEAWFGIAYPFDKLDIVAVPDFAAGAMENAGLVTFRDQLLLLSENPPLSQQRGFAFTMAHELAHQWFGNLVTMAWWDDLWLNEAFATYMETPIVQATFPEFRADTFELMTALEAFDADSLASARTIRNPIESSHDISNAFDGITYSKGASVLAMIAQFMGPERFQAGIRSYLAAHARGNATTADLTTSLVEAAHDPQVAAILDSFTLQPGIPSVTLGDAACTREGASIALSQARYVPIGSSAAREASWAVPVCATYADRAGTVRESCTLLTQASGSLPLEACPTWVWPNPAGRGYYRTVLSEDAIDALGPQVRAALTPPRRGAATPWTAGARGGVASTRDLISLADSIHAAANAGTVSFADALELLAPMAASDQRYVASAPMQLLSFAHDYLVPASDRARLEQRARQMFQPQLRRLGWGPAAGVVEEPDTRSMRAAVLSFLALDARDPDVRRDANERGRAWLGETEGGDHRVHLDAVPPDLVEVSLIVAAQEGDERFFGRMNDELGRSEDGVVRQRLLAAIGRVDDDAFRTRALDLVLDPRLRLNERFRPLSGQFADPAGRAAAWAWLQAHYDAVREVLGPEYAGYLPLVTGGFCDRESAASVRAFFEPRMADTQGGPRNLAAAVETIELCAARAEAQRESAVRWLGARR